MIGFDLTPEQKALQEKARKFANEVILPVAAKYDREGTFPLEVMEKQYILRAYDATGRNKAQTAKLLDIGLNTLRRKLESYGVD